MTLYFNTAVVKQGGAEPVIESLTVTPSAQQQIITASEGVDGFSPVIVNAISEEPLKVDFLTDPMFGDYGSPMCIVKLNNQATKDMIKAHLEQDNSNTFIDGDGQFVWKMWFENGKWIIPEPDTYSYRGNVSTGYWAEYESSYDGYHKMYMGSSNDGMGEILPIRNADITPGAEKLVFQLELTQGYSNVYIPSNNWQHERYTNEWVCDVTWNSDNTFSLSNVIFYGANV